MRRILIIVLCCMAMVSLHAQRVTRTYRDVSIAEALRQLANESRDYTIYFLYDELEDFTITTSIRNKSIPDAIRQMIGFYPISMTMGQNREIYVECTHKTSRHLKGQVVDEHNLPLAYANVALLNPADSTIVGGGVTNESGRFVIPNDHGKVIARVTYVGYKPAYRLCARDNVGTVRMQLEVTKLHETVVTTSKMQIERDGANYTLRNLGGTIMGNAGNAIDLLRWTPGVIVDANETVSLIGRSGETEVYVDNRRVLANSELKSISSQNIKRVEVIREPDAQYASNVGSVIKVFTHSPVKDHLGASLTNVLDIKRKVSNTTTLTLDGKYKKMSGNASFSYGRLNTEVSSLGVTKIADENDGTWLYNKADMSSSTSGGDRYTVFAGMNYALTPKSVIGAQYNGTFYQVDINEQIRQTMVQRLYGSKQMTDRVTRNSTSASYLWQRNDNSQLLVIADYASMRQKDAQNLREFLMVFNSDNYASVAENTILKHYLVVNSNDYDIVTATAMYNFVSRGWNNKMGIEWGHTGSTGTVLLNEVSQTCKRDNDWSGLYYTLSKSWDKWRMNAGLRYEYDYTRTDVEGTSLNKTYHNLLPNASVGLQLSPDIDLSLYYRRTLRRPSYNELRSTHNYINSYQYSTGNPFLRPTITDHFALNANLKGFTASLSYSLMDNATQRIMVHLGSGAVLEYPINIMLFRAWSLDLGYNYSNSWLNLNVQSSATLPHTTYPYFDIIRTESSPFASINVNAQFTVARRYLIGCNLFGSTPWISGFSKNASIVGLNLSARTTLCQGRLLLGVNLNDLFQRSMSPWTKTRYLNVYNETHTGYDIRGISLMARWTFNTISNPFKKRSGNDATLQRTQDNN
ncbi:MAG: TonB-dependent receptor [Muribaculaceae bacterium]|nr:TonB-dependent receptor [Muribaculaceae bacterium]